VVKQDRQIIEKKHDFVKSGISGIGLGLSTLIFTPIMYYGILLGLSLMGTSYYQQYHRIVMLIAYALGGIAIFNIGLGVFSVVMGVVKSVGKIFNE